MINDKIMKYDKELEINNDILKIVKESHSDLCKLLDILLYSPFG